MLTITIELDRDAPAFRPALMRAIQCLGDHQKLLELFNATRILNGYTTEDIDEIRMALRLFVMAARIKA